MIQKIRTSKVSKIIAIYLALMIFLQVTAPIKAYALTGGPTQPEFNSFTPIDTSDMVDLSGGDFNYNIPIMDVGGYPINLAYNSSVSMDQEASWVGLGWDLNVGQINRQLRGLPDDFDGDEMIYENNMKDNITVGGNAGVFATAFGLKEGSGLKFSAGFGVKYNNYDGFGFSLDGGLSYQVSDNLSVGMQMTSSASEGVSVSPSVSLSAKVNKSDTEHNTSLTGSLGTSINSRKGVQSLTMSVSKTQTDKDKNSKGNYDSKSSGTHGAITFNDVTFTPSKRVGMTSSNFMFNMNIESEFWGIEPGIKFSGYRTTQGIKDSEKYKIEKAYGYENSFDATQNDVLDFNREKDRTFTPTSTSLPIINNTYDLYSIQGQGVSGMYRPYKGQVGYVFDSYVNDDSNGGNLGLELGVGGGAHFGIDASVTNTESTTRPWRDSNLAINKFEEKKSGNRPDYEKVFYKNIGGTHVDNDFSLFDSQLGGYAPVRFTLSGGKFSRKADSNFLKKNIAGNNTNINIASAIKREKRVNRTQSIQKLTRLEAAKYGFSTQFSPYALPGKNDHHTAEIRVTKDGGERYIYGRAAYNVTKKEVTFDVSGKQGDCNNGLVNYNPGSDNSPKNNASGDQYFNRVTTPGYAHTYLLTSVLSSDYSDISKDGPTDDDLGTYTKFVYNDGKTKASTYKWRIPYDRNAANYDEGLKSLGKDNKGNYTYGEKEMIYIDTIVTKTHIAIFEISARKDGFGVDGENGGGNASTSSKMYKLDKITLYSKPEFKALGTNATPIKVAHFVYDYSLCTGVKNNFNSSLTANETANQGGKLTLKKVYFTYGKSNMGKYTPYKFNYSTFNPSYDMKAYDSWGNYKPSPGGVGCGVNDALSNAEYPFVDQTNKTLADQYAGAWLLQSIELPSGGNIELKYETDDYRYVQDKEVMQMFKVVGVGNASIPNSSQLTSNVLYGSDETNRVYIKLTKQLTDTNGNGLSDEFVKYYIRGLQDQPVYFRFMLNMSKPGTGNDDKYDFVTGYLELGDSTYSVFTGSDGQQYASIPLKTVDKGGGINSSLQMNPIAKAGWNFGKKYLNRFVYTNSTDESTDDLEEIVKDIIESVPTMLDIIQAPNSQLHQRKIASRFIPGKGWIRLMNPEETKYGGGSRVKEIKMNDQWEVMTSHASDPNYKQSYGQQYSYTTEDGKSSGVATYEPVGNKENPLVQPFYNQNDTGKLLAPEGENYVEKPFGESFYPSAKITYSRVTVKNLPRETYTGTTLTAQVKKHATGKVVTEFFTSRDYPTIADYTDLGHYYDKSNVLAGLLNLSVRDHLTLSQGFSIHTNDMDGKMKSQYVYAEGQTNPISGSEYKYDNLSTQGDNTYDPNTGKLDNTIVTIDSQGTIAKKLVGVDYDVVNDFRQSKTVTTSGGININTAFLPVTFFVIVIPTPLPSYSRHENQIRTAVTTKVIHTTGILREQKVFDGGSTVYTKNLAWDAETGEVLLTETINEYNDKYYSFNYPAYWSYKGMSQAANNAGLTWKLKPVYGTEGKFQFYTTNYNASDYLTEGDELWITPDDNTLEQFKAYVTNVEAEKFTLINEKGIHVTSDNIDNGYLTVIRSGHRNMPTASMASITSMVNPIYNGTALRPSVPDYDTQSWSQYRIINASAIEYNDAWAAQCECRLPKMSFDTAGQLTFNYSTEGRNQLTAYNPYIYNIKGNWRPKASYAYLTGRNYTADPSPRKTGYFNDYKPFYTYNATQKKWIVNTTNKPRWTYASEVTQYNPYGFEVENKDALNRYSSALYGYNFRFPIAVASNTKYRELAYDGFEDYEFNICDTTSHFSVHGNLVPNQVSISSGQAHSGRKSLKMAPRSKAVVKKQIVPCNP